MLTPAEIEVSAEKIGQAKANLALPKAFVLGCMAGFYIGLGQPDARTEALTGHAAVRVG